MIKKLFLTEISGNKYLLALSMVANLLIFILLATRGRELNDFIASSTVVFYVCAIHYAVKANEEKRYRLYAQLPVTSAQISIATWTFIIFLLGINLAFWLLFWFVAEQQSGDYNLYVLLGPFLAVLCLIAAFSVGFNLGTCKPAYLQWVYITGAIATIIIVANLTDFTDGPGDQDSTLMVFPILGWELTALNSLLAFALCLALIAVDHFVYTRSDSYLS